MDELKAQRKSPDTAWPLVGEDGKPYHSRPRPIRESHHIKFLDDCPCDNSWAAKWYVPAIVILVTILWIGAA